jgi:nicotinamidase/pyrazinamidase
MRRFVIVVDAQRDFMQADGALPVGGAEALIAPLGDWLAALRPAETAGVLFTFDTHDAGSYAESAEAEQFPLHCVRGTAGWQLVVDFAELHHAIPLYRMEKPVFDMWADPGGTIEAIGDFGRTMSRFGHMIARDRFFDELAAAGVRDVTVVGVAADFCVRWAVEGLIARGFRVTVPTELTRGIVRQIDAVREDEWEGAAVALA